MARIGPPGWLLALNLTKANANLREEEKGDWYRDPWSWPEWDYTAETDKDLLYDHLLTSDGGRLAPIEVPKENFGARPAVVLGPLDRLSYQAMVDALGVSVLKGMPEWVFGWRFGRTQAVAGEYSPNDDEWRFHQSHLFDLSKVATVGLKTDLTSFFASVPVEQLAEVVTRRGSGSIADRLVQLLLHWSDTPGRTGLPQRSTASAVLANMYLAPMDLRIAHHARQQKLNTEGDEPPVPASRWMDDVWLVGTREAPLRQAQVDLIHTVRDLGLELHAGKTEVLEGEALRQALGRLHLSGVDYALSKNPADTSPLEPSLNQILESPSSADRSLVRFVAVRLRRAGKKAEIRKLLDVAHKMPHAADHLARAFRDAGMAPELQDWFLAYCRQGWSVFPWAEAQFATIFPTSMRRPKPELLDVLTGWLGPGEPVERMAVAVQRLSRWDPSRLKDIVTDLSISANHPMERRILGLAAATVGLDRRVIRGYLTAYKELSATQSLVAALNYKAPAIVTDFDTAANN